MNKLDQLLADHARLILTSTPGMVEIAERLGDMHLADRYADLGLEAAFHLGFVSLADVRADRGGDPPFPWCEPCGSYHHVANPTCRRRS